MAPDSAPMLAWVKLNVSEAEDKQLMEWMLHFEE
jgi:hypothetical protein